MPAGKLTIQAWHEERDRATAWQIERDRQLADLTREIESLITTYGPRRRPSFIRRFIRSINLGF